VGVLAEAYRRFAALSNALERHMAAEEALLFPALLRMSEPRGGPPCLACSPSMGSCALFCLSWKRPWPNRMYWPVKPCCRQVRRSLARHHEDEEHLVYPISDWALSPEEQEDLINRLHGD